MTGRRSAKIPGSNWATWRSTVPQAYSLAWWVVVLHAVSYARERKLSGLSSQLSKLAGMPRNTFAVLRDVSAQPAGRHRVGVGAKTHTEARELRPRRLGEEMNCHQQIVVVGEGNK